MRFAKRISTAALGIVLGFTCLADAPPEPETPDVTSNIALPPGAGIFADLTCGDETKAPQTERTGVIGVILMGHVPGQFTIGLAIAPLLENYSGSDVTGVYLGLAGLMNEMTGLQLSALNRTTCCTGVQLGLAANFSDAAYGIQTAPINAVNHFSGLQLGLINSQGKNSWDPQEDAPRPDAASAGGQAGLWNIAAGTGTVTQLGVVNIHKGKGIQFGLLNFSSNGFLPFFPLINFTL